MRFYPAVDWRAACHLPARVVNRLLEEIPVIRAEEALFYADLALFGNMGAGDSLGNIFQRWREQAGYVDMDAAIERYPEYDAAGRKVLNHRPEGMRATDSLRSWFAGLNNGNRIRGIG